MRVRDKQDKNFIRGLLTPLQMFERNRLMLGRAEIITDEQLHYKWASGIPQLQLSSIVNTEPDDLQYDQDVTINDLDITFFLTQKSSYFTDADGEFGKGTGNIGKYGIQPIQSIPLPSGLPIKEIKPKVYEPKEVEYKIVKPKENKPKEIKPKESYRIKYKVDDIDNYFRISGMKMINYKDCIDNYSANDYYASDIELEFSRPHVKYYWGLNGHFNRLFLANRRDNYIQKIKKDIKKTLSKEVTISEQKVREFGGSPELKRIVKETEHRDKVKRIQKKEVFEKPAIVYPNLERDMLIRDDRSKREILDEYIISRGLGISSLPGSVYRVKYNTKHYKMDKGR